MATCCRARSSIASSTSPAEPRRSRNRGRRGPVTSLPSARGLPGDNLRRPAAAPVVLRSLACCLLVLALAGAGARAQVPEDGAPADSLLVDPQVALPDTVVVDTVGVAVPESPPLDVPVAPPAEGGLERPVTYTARDSLRITLAGRDTTAADRATLYGEVTARYEEATLTAGVLELDFAQEELRALPAGVDSTGQPVPARFAQGEEQFTGREFVYN